jgi:hypothetical protein
MVCFDFKAISIIEILEVGVRIIEVVVDFHLVVPAAGHQLGALLDHQKGARDRHLIRIDITLGTVSIDHGGPFLRFLFAVEWRSRIVRSLISKDCRFRPQEFLNDFPFVSELRDHVTVKGVHLSWFPTQLPPQLLKKE